MKESKIIENRTELTQAEIEKGMKFSEIKANSMILKKAAAKMLLIKSAVLFVLATSAIATFVVLKNRMNKTTDLIAVPPIIQSSTPIISNESTDSTSISNTKILKTDETTNSSKNGSRNNSFEKKKSMQLPLRDTIIVSKQTGNEDLISSNNNSEAEKKLEAEPEKNNGAPLNSTQKNVVPDHVLNGSTTQCRIWKSNDYCDLPSSSKMIKSFDCDMCTLYDVKCQDLNGDEKLHAVWITINVKGKASIELNSKFKNVTLINAAGKEIHPYFIALTKGDLFLSNNSKMKSLSAIFEKQIDVFLFFSEASIGNRIIFDHFQEGIITE